MPRKPNLPAPDDPAESKRFIDMARELGADESEKGREAFKRAFNKIVRPKRAVSSGVPKHDSNRSRE